MKAARELNRLRSNVASKCIEKFTMDETADPSGLINFLHNVTHTTEPIDSFISKARMLIDEGNITQFGGYFESLSYDDLSQINAVEKLGIIDGLAVASMDSRPQQQAAIEEEVIMPKQDALSLTLNNLLLAFELPKTFKEFRDLDEVQKVKLCETGIDGTSARKYNPDAVKKATIGNLVRFIKEENKESEFFHIGNIPSILEQKLINRYRQQIDSDKTFFQSKIVPICTETLQHLATENQTIKAKERVLSLARANQIAITDIHENQSKGVNQSFTAMVNDKKHYIKTCSDYITLASGSKVDPNELFVYKVMEYMNFGPKTNFLFGRYSSAAGRSSVSRGNYIMTEDLNQNGDRLLLDLEENKEAFERALTDRDFTVELSAASALNDILSLTDTFGRNTRNYGLVERNDGSKTIQFVDHLPNANNGLFSLMDFDPATYSPRDSLQKRSNLFKADEHSAFKQLEPNRSSFQRLIVQMDVDSRLAPLSDAVTRAESDVRGLMRNYSENFVDGADVRMTSYMEKITRNRATYEKTLPQTGQERL